MIERAHPALSVGAQCRLLSIARSSFYYAPQGETEMNLALMKLIDRQFLETPFYGVRQMTWHLQNEGHPVNQKRIRRLMRRMRLMPIYQKPDTRCPAAHAKPVRKGASPPKDTRPTLTCWVACGSIGLTRSGAPTSPICRCGAFANVTRTIGVTIGSLLYLVAIMDWFTRKVLAWGSVQNFSHFAHATTA
ncbi:MAG: IS3 family transposase, partial [Pseudomonadota bacterium]